MTDDPFALFDAWFAEARESEPNDPEAMALATADRSGQPSLRMVLMKDHGPAGFTFYTNEGSEKGRELAENPRAALLFHWKSLRRQVRAEGPVEMASEAEADSYFATRGRDSQLGAWALPGKTWAPEVISVGDGYVMFYTAADQASGRQCIGRAAAAAPEGPFVDDAAVPFVCQPDLGGSIDPNPVRAPDGTPVNALRGYLDMTAMLLERFSPAAYAACWDADWRPAWRTDLLPSYKAHRVAQDAGPDEEEVPDELSPQVPLVAEAV